ncbi:hypothetical protein IVA88_28225 [Bradyrhizobium sp. 149]|uniref:hypothetical protein n=1 Tax=Bradyrhizobium sp. 149 TaxID=2782624 RepID=UPI001FFBF8FD|nr:hypothetical protein [Bradyrhizobium sp. 149]MCK1655299.1 hypothetical protein [Bradyrhizobium sp. 149]
MIADNSARAHHINIQRYHLLLQTTLTEFERQFVERRLREEQSKLKMLVSSRSSNLHHDQSSGPDDPAG